MESKVEGIDVIEKTIDKDGIVHGLGDYVGHRVKVFILPKSQS